MEKSPTIAELAKALSSAQSEFKNILKSSTARIKSARTGSEYSYSYADLGDVIDSVMPIVSKNGLSISQCSNTFEGKPVITTILMHTSGEWIQNSLTLPMVETGNNAIQSIGAAITYGRRYEISSILGVASEEDTDSVHVKTSTVEVTSSTARMTTLKDRVEGTGIAKFGSGDKFKAWRVDNQLPEDLSKSTDTELNHILNLLRKKK